MANGQFDLTDDVRWLLEKYAKGDIVTDVEFESMIRMMAKLKDVNELIQYVILKCGLEEND